MTREPRPASPHAPSTGTDTADLDRVLESALTVAGTMGWTKGTLAQVAEEANLPLARVLSLLPTQSAVLVAWGKRIDAQILEEGLTLDPEETVRDRLFDLIMRRLDALAPHKAAVAALSPVSVRDPLVALTAAMGLSRSMGMTLEAAGVGTSGVAGLVRVKALSALFLYVLRTWLSDDSADMAKTMAALDKALEMAESAANSLFSGPMGKSNDSPSLGAVPGQERP